MEELNEEMTDRVVLMRQEQLSLFKQERQAI